MENIYNFKAKSLTGKNISMEDFMIRIQKIADYQDLIQECQKIGDVVREEQKISAKELREILDLIEKK